MHCSSPSFATKRRLKRGVFSSLVDLQAAINRYLKEHNYNPTPFVWTTDPNRIIEKVRRGYHAFESIHWRLIGGAKPHSPIQSIA
jgi:hypothetical protein